ncbi:MAG: peptidylprolyl isomerase [Planctomycetota bacterium]|jgi:parvulin-like peptidyl-prolyl isomerase
MCRFIFSLIFILLLLGGCDKSSLSDAEKQRLAVTQKIELVEAAGGYVLMVGGETITSDQIIDTRTQLNGMFVSPKEYFGPIAQANELEQFKERAREPLEEILISKISNILLYQHAKRQMGGNIDEGLQKAAENEYKNFVLGFGGDQARADDELKRILMDKNSFIEQQKRAILIQSYMASKMPNNRPVTYREMIDCYDRIKDKYFAKASKIRFRLIDIQPEKLELEDPNDDPWHLGNKIVNQLLRRIKSGEDFGELAKEYSHGDWKDFGGLWRAVQPSSLAEPYDILAAEAEKLEPGEVAGPIVTKQHIFIMKLQEKQIAGYEPFEDVQELVEQKILLDRRNEVINKLNSEVRWQANLSRTDKFIDACLEKIYRISNTDSDI